MAENKIDSTVIKRTQDSLGKYVKKPPLTEKLLKKPPFRFLYDVFNAVMKETGCFEGLYTVEEQNIENIKDRDDKMKYLQKMIDVIKIVTKRAITVRTSKIVAGQEAEKTNELLQLIGEVIEKKLDWRSAVDSVVNKSSSPTKPHKAPEKVKEKNSKSKEHSKDLRKESKTLTTISPTSKEDPKNKLKNSSPNEKPKTDAKSNKEKQGSETTNKASKKAKEEKAKTIKSKTVVKDKTLSPKDKPKEPKIIPVNEEVQNASKEENDKEKERPITPTKDMVVSPIQKNAIIEVPVAAPVLQDQSAASQNSELMIHKTTNNVLHTEQKEKESPKRKEVLNTTNNEVHNDTNDSPKKSESRKSSANRKSSGKSRRSSANKIRNNENEITQSSLNQTESLNILNEEESPKSVPSTNSQNSALDQPKSKVESPKLIDNAAHHTVKRESTFTRENSKDSNNNRPRTSLRPPSARPASARPGAPRRRDRNVEIVLQSNDQIKMSGVNVKLETFGDFGDDGENLVIIENTNIDETLGEQGSKSATTDGGLKTEDTMEQQGHLVQQILETQKELVQQNNDLTGRQDKDSEVSSTINMRQSSARQMNNLRDIIQNLTKSVNPFGKLMDFIPEDIDAMQLELTMWRDSYTQTANELRKEKSLTESVTEPMKNQLIQIEANIKEYQEIIDASHNKILQNSEKILKMLTEQ